MNSVVDDESVVGALKSKWNSVAETWIDKQKINPFSDLYKSENRPKWKIGSAEYGKPVGLTAVRAEKAKKYIDREIKTLIDIIFRIGRPAKDGHVLIDFGHLFQTYASISTNLVGYLIRARRRKLVEFPGEMLWQRRDDHVLIHLTKSGHELIEPKKK